MLLARCKIVTWKFLAARVWYRLYVFTFQFLRSNDYDFVETVLSVELHKLLFIDCFHPETLSVMKRSIMHRARTRVDNSGEAMHDEDNYARKSFLSFNTYSHHKYNVWILNYINLWDIFLLKHPFQNVRVFLVTVVIPLTRCMEDGWCLTVA